MQLKGAYMPQKLVEASSLRYIEWLKEIFFDTNRSNQEQVLQFRHVLEGIYNELTENSKERFDSLFSKAKYINEITGMDSKLASNINGVRIFMNGAIHNSISNVTDQDVHSLCYYILKLIHNFSDIEDKQLYTDLKRRKLRDFLKRRVSSHKAITALRICVDRFSEPEINNNTYKCDIYGTEEDSPDEIRVSLWNLREMDSERVKFKYGRRLGQLSKLIWKGCTLQFHDIKQHSEDEHHYLSGNNTVVVIEPDYLLDATSIASCFQNKYAYHNLAILSLLDSFSSSTALIKGNFVNQILDKLISDPKQEFNALYRECVHSSLLTSLSLGTKPLVDIMKDIKQNHYPNLVNLSNRLKELKLTIEPTFYSPSYGLFGRLDAMIEGESDDPNRRSIFELKSGRLPNYGVWKGHEIQVAVYDLLLKSTFGKERSGTSMIFYSGDKKGELRNVTTFPIVEQHLLMVRNCIIKSLHDIAERKTSIINITKSIDIEKIPKYSIDRFKELSGQLGELTEIEANYFTEYFSFLIRELWASKTGTYSQSSLSTSRNYGLSSIWKSSLLEKDESAKSLSHLEFDKFEDNILEFKRREDDSVVSFRAGDRVIIYPVKDSINLADHSQIIKCAIKDIDAKALYLIPRNTLITADYFRNNDYWIIDTDKSDSSITTLLSSLSTFITSPTHHKRVMLGVDEPQFDNSFSYNESSDYLNPLITKALSAKDYFLLQGPPGTGKTSSFLMSCLKDLYNKSSENILVLSFTNRAIDEVCLKLNQQNLPYIRLGKKRSDEINSLNDIIQDDIKLSEIHTELVKYRIFCSTMASYHANKDNLNSIISFDTLFVDEASQLIEPELIGVAKFFKRFILIGDQNQLPAISIQSEENQRCMNETLNDMGISNFRQSLFERLFNNAKSKGWSRAYDTLTTHYRMHDNIAQLVNHFYSNSLNPGLDRQESSDFINDYGMSSDKIISSLLKKSRIIFIDVRNEDYDSNSPNEAIIVTKLANSITEFKGDTLAESSLGIISNRRSQINLIRDSLQFNECKDMITIDTVERYQGSERDVIIYSTATNYRYQLSTIQSLTPNRKVDRKLNVALSRSKEQIIILGNAKILNSTLQYAKLIEDIKMNGLYLNFNEAKKMFLNN